MAKLTVTSQRNRKEQVLVLVSTLESQGDRLQKGKWGTNAAKAKLELYLVDQLQDWTLTHSVPLQYEGPSAACHSQLLLVLSP